jgi:hypothetical protein
MMVKKSDENSRALALNETVGENYSPTSRYVIIIIFTLIIQLQIIIYVVIQKNAFYILNQYFDPKRFFK